MLTAPVGISTRGLRMRCDHIGTAGRLQPGLVVVFFAVLGVVPAVSADTPTLEDIFQTALACRLAESELANMPVSSVHTLGASGCEVVTPAADGVGLGRDLYVDAGCQTALPYEATSLSDWCNTLLDESALGEGEGVVAAPDAQSWTLSPGVRLDLGARSLDDLPQPWLQRRVFREVDTDRGVCRLEMRVYAPRPVVDGVSPIVDDGTPLANGRALIAWHGGSWSGRGFGFLGLELTVPHFTARGFTVFAPFYRLLGDSEGSAACNRADFETDIVADAAAAVDWVNVHGSRYGVSGAPVVFGQSAGGQLAARIAADRPQDIASAVLFYAPVDFLDFVTRAQTGRYTDEQGLDILTRVVDQPVNAVDVSASPVPENSLPQRVASDGVPFPDVFMLHGDADELVESRQSMRLCQAINGDELIASDLELETISSGRQVFLCGERSSLHRVRQGQHALDLCISSTIIPTDLCLSGSEASRALVADAIGSATAFAASTVSEVTDELLTDDEPPEDVEDDAADITAAGSGSGASSWLTMLALLTLIGTRFSAVPGRRVRTRMSRTRRCTRARFPHCRH